MAGHASQSSSVAASAAASQSFKFKEPYKLGRRQTIQSLFGDKHLEKDPTRSQKKDVDEDLKKVVSDFEKRLEKTLSAFERRLDDRLGKFEQGEVKFATDLGENSGAIIKSTASTVKYRERESAKESMPSSVGWLPLWKQNKDCCNAADLGQWRRRFMSINEVDGIIVYLSEKTGDATPQDFNFFDHHTVVECLDPIVFEPIDESTAKELAENADQYQLAFSDEAKQIRGISTDQSSWHGKFVAEQLPKTVIPLSIIIYKRPISSMTPDSINGEQERLVLGFDCAERRNAWMDKIQTIKSGKHVYTGKDEDELD